MVYANATVVNFVDIFTYLNNISNGSFGIGLTLMTWIVMFASMKSIWKTEVAWLYSSFTLALIIPMLNLIGIAVADWLVAVPICLLIIGLFMMKGE